MDTLSGRMDNPMMDWRDCQFVPAKVRCFLDALDVHALRSAAQETEPLPG